MKFTLKMNIEDENRFFMYHKKAHERKSFMDFCSARVTRTPDLRIMNPVPLENDCFNVMIMR